MRLRTGLSPNAHARPENPDIMCSHFSTILRNRASDLCVSLTFLPCENRILVNTVLNSLLCAFLSIRRPQGRAVAQPPPRAQRSFDSFRYISSFSTLFSLLFLAFLSPSSFFLAKSFYPLVKKFHLIVKLIYGKLALTHFGRWETGAKQRGRPGEA